MDVRLTAEQIAFFWENGYVWVERITTEEELARLGELYDELFRDKRGGVRGGYFDLSRPYEAAGEDLLPQILLPELIHPELRESLFFRNGRRLAAQIFDVEPDLHGLLTDEVDPTPAAPVPLPAGGAALHHCRTLHYSGPNRSGRMRRAYTNEFQAEPTPRGEPYARPWFREMNASWARRSL